jgi:hypothetical protein
MSNKSHLYPLYDELVRKVKARSENGVDIKRLCSTINNIAQTNSTESMLEHYAEIGALILHYEFIITGSIPTAIPYDAKIMVGGKGILYTITSMPPDLQRIIGQYIEDQSESCKL